MAFPASNIDPKLKNRDWCLQCVKSFWTDSEQNQPKTIFYRYAKEYDRIKSYAHGRQDTTQYRAPMHIDDQSNTTWAVLDFKIIPIIKKHRRIALSRLQKTQYNIVATPIDAQAQDEADTYFAQMGAKLKLRNAVKQANPQLANAPALAHTAGDPMDEEELEMRMQYGFRHAYAMDIELGIQVIFNENNIERMRNQFFEDLFDYGVAVSKDWMDANGKIRLRRVDPRAYITNFCRYEDFSDMWFGGEVVEMSWTDFREKSDGQFSEQDFEKIFEVSKLGMNSVEQNIAYTRRNDKMKLRVLDIVWLSEDSQMYEDTKNKFGNPVFPKTNFSEKPKENVVVHKRTNIYKAKWVVGTDYIYDYGLENFIKRPKGVSKTELPYHVIATNFHEMRASGIMEDLIPIADGMAIAWLKLQNIRNELKPFYIDIDLDALEDVPLGKGGEQLSPKQLLEMWSQNGILVSRRKGLAKDAPNYKTIDFVATNYGEAIQAAWMDFNNFNNLLMQATGFNEMTSGATPDPKTQNPATAAAIESTDNALYHLSNAEKNMLLANANAVLMRLKRAAKMGQVKGYAKSLSTGTLKFISMSPDIDAHEYGLMLEDKPTPEQKQYLNELMAKGMQDGTMDATDIITVENTFNLKQAEQILSYRISRRKQEQQQNALQMQSQNAQVQVQSAQAAAQNQAQLLQVEYQLKQQLEGVKGDIELKKLYLELCVKYGMTIDQIHSQERMQMQQLGVQDPSAPLQQTPNPQQGQPQQQPDPSQGQPQQPSPDGGQEQQQEGQPEQGS